MQINIYITKAGSTGVSFDNQRNAFPSSDKQNCWTIIRRQNEFHVPATWKNMSCLVIT